MTLWEELSRALDCVDPLAPARSTVLDLNEAADAAGLLTAETGSVPAAVVQALAEADRSWVTCLAQDPDVPRARLDTVTQRCKALRESTGRSALPLHYAQVEILGTLGQYDEAVEQLRVARLFSFGQADTTAVLAAARMHDDFSGVIRTTSAARMRPEANPVEVTRALGAALLPYLAQGRRVEAEDFFASLALTEVPGPVRLRVLGDQLEYLGMSSQWERAFALLRHTELTSDTCDATAWVVMNAAVGLSLVLRQAVRADYGRNALGLSLGWTTPWARLSVSGWDTVAHAYDLATAFVRAISVRFDRRNGNNGVSYRVETRMAAEAARLAARSYGTVTADGPVDRSRLRARSRLLREVRELLTQIRGYGLDPVRERAMSTAEEVSASLAEVTDDATLEVVVDLRLAFARLLQVLGASERAEKENLDTAELCLSQGWTELACAAMALASHAAQARGDTAASQAAWRRCGEELSHWPSGRQGERCTILTTAIGDPGLAAQVLDVLASALVEGVEEDTSRAPVVREVLSHAATQLAHTAHPPHGVAESLAATEARVAPYGRGRGHRRRPGAGAGAHDAGATSGAGDGGGASSGPDNGSEETRRLSRRAESSTDEQHGSGP